MNIEPKIRMTEITKLFKVSPSTVYRWIKSQDFPKPIKLSPSCSVWNKSEVQAWEFSRKRMHEGEA